MENLELGNMIVALRQELAEAQKNGEDQGIAFKVEDIELELQLVAQKDTKRKLGAKFFVLDSSLDTTDKSIVTHRLKLKLIPVGKDGGPVHVNDEDTK